MTDKVLETQDLSVKLGTELNLSFPNLNIRLGERVLLRGPSGSGKSTLLNLVAGIRSEYSGSLKFLGTEVSQFSAAERDHLRAREMGYIFQSFNLIPYLNVMENVLLPSRLSATLKTSGKISGPSVAEAAVAALEHMGLGSLLQQRVSQLSIGQQQRVASVRELLKKPKLLLADEPTSALDTKNRDLFMKALMDLCHQSQCALLCVSHDPSISGYFDRSLELV